MEEGEWRMAKAEGNAGQGWAGENREDSGEHSLKSLYVAFDEIEPNSASKC
jgi:hypothetical protein